MNYLFVMDQLDSHTRGPPRHYSLIAPIITLEVNRIIKMYTASLSQLIEAVFGNMVTLKAPRHLTRP